MIMFDDPSASASSSSASTNPSAAAAALTLVALNAAGVGAATPGPSVQHSQQRELAQLLTGKDSRWLQLEVCREFQRGQCSRSDQECKAHPAPHVEVQNGKVTACYDSIKGRCTRENPRCKYLHPPQHLKDQLLATGKQNLVMKNLVAQQLSHQHQHIQPTLAQLVQPGTAPLALQSAAGLPLPFFATATLPGLYPAGTTAFLPQVDPFGGIQTTQPPGSASVSVPSANAVQQQLAVAQQLALLQQQQQQHAGSAGLLGLPPSSVASNGNASSAAAVQLLLAQQQATAAAAQQQQQQQLLLYLALQQQQQQQQQQIAAAMMAAQQQQAQPIVQSPSPEQQGCGAVQGQQQQQHQIKLEQYGYKADKAGGGAGGSGRKRNARAAGLTEQPDETGSSTDPVQQQLQLQQQLAAAHAAANATNGTSAAFLSPKRPALDSQSQKALVASLNGAAATTAAGGLPLYHAASVASMPGAPFNPYLLPAGAAPFLSAVSFAGPLPPRFG